MQERAGRRRMWRRGRGAELLPEKARQRRCWWRQGGEVGRQAWRQRARRCGLHRTACTCRRPSRRDRRCSRARAIAGEATSPFRSPGRTQTSAGNTGRHLSAAWVWQRAVARAVRRHRRLARVGARAMPTLVWHRDRWHLACVDRRNHRDHTHVPDEVRQVKRPSKAVLGRGSADALLRTGSAPLRGGVAPERRASSVSSFARSKKSESFGKRGLAWVIAVLVPTNPARVSTGQNGLP